MVVIELPGTDKQLLTFQLALLGRDNLARVAEHVGFWWYGVCI